jgi:hypothetical protein
MQEIWCASNNPRSWTSVKRGAILPVWWSLFILSNALDDASLRLSVRVNNLDELLWATGLEIASGAASIPATIAALILIKQIFAMQMGHDQPHID